MRVPGSRPVTSRVVRWFELTPADQRVVRRGWRTGKAAVTGSATGWLINGGNPFDNPKAAAATIATSAIVAAAGKKTRESTGG